MNRLDSLKKMIGEEYLFNPNTEYLPTGLYILDKYLLGGGIPRGNIMQFFGRANRGKSYLALWLCANLHKRSENSLTAWLDAEGAYNQRFAEAVGVNDERHLVLSDNLYCAEDYYQKVRELVAMNEFDIIVLDSLAMLRPREIVEAGLEGEKIKANQNFAASKLAANEFRGLVSGFKVHNINKKDDDDSEDEEKRKTKEKYCKISETKTCFIVINHIYEDIQIGFNPMPFSYKETIHRMKGGVEPLHATSIAIEFINISDRADAKDKETAKDKDLNTPQYLTLSLKCVKSRYGITGSIAQYRLYAEEGRLESIDYLDEIRELKDKKLLTLSGAWYSLKKPDSEEFEKVQKKENVVSKAIEWGYLSPCLNQ